MENAQKFTRKIHANFIYRLIIFTKQDRKEREKIHKYKGKIRQTVYVYISNHGFIHIPKSYIYLFIYSSSVSMKCS